MILYVNGDSHSAGVGCGGEFGSTTDDSNLAHIGEAPHPDNLMHSFGAILARKYNWELVCQARQGGSVDRSIRTAKQFVYQAQGDIFVLLGIPSIEREEWFYEGAWYQVNASGQESIPKGLRHKYKQWVTSWQSGFDYYVRQLEIHQKLIDFHNWLLKHKINHLFFNATQTFQPEDRPDVLPEEHRFCAYDWQESFYKPYGEPFDTNAFTNWCIDKKFKSDVWGHFGKDAHQAWATEIEPYIFKALK